MQRLLVSVMMVVMLASCQRVPATSPRAQQATPQVSPTVRAQQMAAEAKVEETIDQEPAAAAPVKITKTVKVGLLLPLSGRNAALGQAMQDAATLSLFDRYARLSVTQQATEVKLLTKDSGDSPEKARAAMQEALAEGVSLVIGPVFSDATEAVAPLAAAKKVPVLSFSNSRRGGKAGTYLLGFSPNAQAIRVLRYAVTQNKKRIGVLVPQSPLGDEVTQAADTVAKESGKLAFVRAQYSQGGMEAAIETLTAAGPLDAVLLAETGDTLDALLRALAAKGIAPDTTQFLGTGVWDDTALLAKVNLGGAWLASSNPMVTQQYEARFKATYGYTPPRLSSLAYDAVALAVTLAATGREFNAATLGSASGFTGPANGLFRLFEGTVAERGLAVLRVESGKLRVIDAAPKGF